MIKTHEITAHFTRFGDSPIITAETCWCAITYSDSHSARMHDNVEIIRLDGRVLPSDSLTRGIIQVLYLDGGRTYRK